MPTIDFPTLRAALVEQASRGSDAVILTFVAADGSARDLTVTDLHSRADQLARALAGAHVFPGEVLPLLLPHSPELVTAFWGAILLGAIPVILPLPSPRVTPDNQREQILSLHQRLAPRIMLTTAAIQQIAQVLMAGSGCEVLSLEGILESPTRHTDYSGADSNAGDQPAYVQLSSGTTGPQKGIVLQHSAVLNNLRAATQAVELQADDTVVSWLPLHHDMGLLLGVLLPVVTGNRAVLLSPLDWVKDPGLLFRAIRNYRASVCWMPNFAFNHCVRSLRQRDRDALNLESMRVLVNASEPVRWDSLELFFESFHGAGLRRSALRAAYGMAEVTAAVTVTPPGGAARVEWVSLSALQREQRAVCQPPSSPGSIPLVSSGRPVSGVEVKVVDAQDQPLPERRVGQIVIMSNARLLGTLGVGAQVSRSDSPWVHSGDLGFMADGELFVTGRIKDLIITGGRNIHPEDIEALAQGLEELRPGRVAAFGLEDPTQGTEAIVLVCETRAPLAEADRWALIRKLRRRSQQRLEVVLADVQLVESGWIVKTSSGKIARSANREKYRQQFQEPGPGSGTSSALPSGVGGDPPEENRAR